MRKIYAKSWLVFRQGLLLFVVLAVLLEALAYFFQASGGTSMGPTIAAILVAFYVHRYFLKGEDYFSRGVMSKTSKYDHGGMFKFAAIAFGLIVLAVVLALVIIIAVVGEDPDENTVLVFAIVGGAFAYWIILSLFGTLLPAAADRDPRYRLKSGIAKTGVTMVRLLAGPGLAGVVLISAITAISIVQIWIGLEPNFWFERFLGAFASLAGFFLLTLTAATLCSVYREIVPAPEPNAA
jgi:hypothetical protein